MALRRNKMKILRTLSVTALAMAMIAPNAQAVPIYDFDVLFDTAITAGANLTKSNFNTSALGVDALWAASANSQVKFKAEVSGYNNTMGYADASGNNRVQLLDEGITTPANGGWVTMGAAVPNPFTFYLDTNNANGDVWFSDDSLNSDFADHLLVFQYANSESKYALFWDDQFGGGDRDFNDFVARANFIDVPAPGTFVIFGLGLLALGYARKRKS